MSGPGKLARRPTTDGLASREYFGSTERRAIQSALKQWLGGMSDHGRRAYIGDLRLFAQSATKMDSTDPVDHVIALIERGRLESKELVETWRDQMTEAGLQPTTVARRLTSLRSLVDVLQRELGLPWTLRTIKGPSYDPYARSTGPKAEIVERVLVELQKKAQSEHGGALAAARNLAIVALLYHSALRKSSVLNLTWGNIHFEDSPPWVSVRVKGGATRKSPISNACREALLFWRHSATNDGIDTSSSARVFVALGGAAPGRRSLSGDAVLRLTKTLGLGHPHGLRHTAATEVWRRSGGNLRTVQALLGHKNAATTQVYLDAQGDEAAEATAILAYEQEDA